LVLVNVTTGRCSQTSPPKPRIEIADQRRPDGSISASPFSPRVDATCSTFQSQPLGLRSSAFSPGEVFRPNGADRRHPTDGIRPPRSRQSSSESLRRANTGLRRPNARLRQSDCVDRIASIAVLRRSDTVRDLGDRQVEHAPFLAELLDHAACEAIARLDLSAQAVDLWPRPGDAPLVDGSLDLV